MAQLSYILFSKNLIFRHKNIINSHIFGRKNVPIRLIRYDRKENIKKTDSIDSYFLTELRVCVKHSALSQNDLNYFR